VDPREIAELNTFHLGLCFILSVGFLGLILKGADHVHVRSQDRTAAATGSVPVDAAAQGHEQRPRARGMLRRRGMWASIFTGPQGITSAPNVTGTSGGHHGWLTSR
jgi:hypothetical protein